MYDVTVMTLCYMVTVLTITYGLLDQVDPILLDPC